MMIVGFALITHWPGWKRYPFMRCITLFQEGVP